MRKQVKAFPLVIAMIIGMLMFVSSSFFFAVRATYVEGGIKQDTLWTLTDSPFVVSNDITVYPNSTLTIEPGVEVRFGGNFSLIVNGQLTAIGTQDRIITFTSNREQPGAGDWNAIDFSGTTSSTMVFCSVKYADNGVFIRNGLVEIRNCEICNNLLNGICIENGNIKVDNNVISNNSQYGIVISDGQVQVRENTLRSNAIGLVLMGTPTLVNISQNTVLSNTQSGMLLDASDYSNAILLHNVISANNVGFRISNRSSTLITNNSISYNTWGFLYEGDLYNEAHWNDIYGNEYGMDVTPAAHVNATYNYWGDASGPYHNSLNPTGKGNEVGGDGRNLDFIFFLTAPIGYINQRPIARLLTDRKIVSPNQLVTLIGTTSSDDGQVDQYFFDFGDGKSSGWTTLSIFVHKYSSLGTFNATLRVRDDFDIVSSNTVTVKITCQTLTPLTVSLSSSSLTVGSENQLPVTVLTTDGSTPVGDANVTLLSIAGGGFAPSFGLTNSTGYLLSTFTAPSVTRTTGTRMIAMVSKAGYADGSNYENIIILPPLMIQITADPDRVKSEEFSNIKTHVTYDGAPVSEVTVTASLAGWGSLDHQIKTTDANGDCAFIFTAPQTSLQINTTFTAVAAKSGYIDGQGQTRITVDPLMLEVQVVADPVSIYSEKTSNITIHVRHESNPVSDATVVLSSNSGTFDAVNRTTDANGDCTFTFTSPQVAVQTNITITATATKIGYAVGTNQTTVIVNLGTLVIHVSANPVIVDSPATSTVTAHVTYNGHPVANAVVAVSSTANGSLSVTSGVTDTNGDCTFDFTAPQTSTQINVTITAIATKSGYLEGQSQTGITVNPAAPGPSFGLPLPIILAIVAIIIVVVVIIVLIKLKVIEVSSKGA